MCPEIELQEMGLLAGWAREQRGRYSSGRGGSGCRFGNADTD